MTEFRRYREAVAAIRATGRSSEGWVTVTREPDGDLDVSISLGMTRRLTADEAAAEIRSALLAAVADHRRQYIEARVRQFGSPLGVTAFEPPEPLPADARPEREDRWR